MSRTKDQNISDIINSKNLSNSKIAERIDSSIQNKSIKIKILKCFDVKSLKEIHTIPYTVKLKDDIVDYILDHVDNNVIMDKIKQSLSSSAMKSKFLRVLDASTVKEIASLDPQKKSENTGAKVGGPKTTGAKVGGPKTTGAKVGGPKTTGAKVGGPKKDSSKKTGKKTAIEIAKDSVKFKQGDQFVLDRKTFKIIKYLTEREDSIMYMGEWLEATNSNTKNVFIKVQPRHKKTMFQITTESHIMSKLSQMGCDTLSQRAIAYGSYDDRMYILVSSLHGDDLLALKDSGNIPEIKRVAKAAVDAIESIHKCGYVHRDIKHENLVYEKRGVRSGNVVIIDYGLAESIYDRNNVRKTKELKGEGSPLYMAIKQHTGQPVDFMHDLEAIAYMVLDLLGRLRWRTEKPEKLDYYYNEKMKFLKEYNDGTLEGNDKLMGEIVKYTCRDTVSDYNPADYKYVKSIIDKLS